MSTRAVGLVTALLAMAMVLIGACPTLAQTILDRVEQNARDQADLPDAAAPDTGATSEGGPDAAPSGATAVKASGTTEPGYLGVIADDRNEQGRGVRVMDVAAGGAAEKAGLLKGDLITSIDRAPVLKMDDMGAIMSRMTVGSRMDFGIERGGAAQVIEVTLIKRPVGNGNTLPTGRLPDGADQKPTLNDAPTGGNLGTAITPTSGPRLGVRTLPVTEDARQQFQLPAASGALVSAVTLGSPADQAGMPTGAVITAVDGQPITTPEDLGRVIRAAQPGQVLEFTYLYRAQAVLKRIALAAPTATGTGAAAVALPAPSNVGTLPAPTAQPPRVNNAFPQTTRVQSPDARIAELENRIQDLEARLRALEAAGGR